MKNDEESPRWKLPSSDLFLLAADFYGYVLTLEKLRSNGLVFICWLAFALLGAIALAVFGCLVILPEIGLKLFFARVNRPQSNNEHFYWHKKFRVRKMDIVSKDTQTDQGANQKQAAAPPAKIRKINFKQ